MLRKNTWKGHSLQTEVKMICIKKEITDEFKIFVNLQTFVKNEKEDRRVKREGR